MASKDRERSLGQNRTGSKPLQLASSSSRRQVVVAVGIIVAAGLLAYHNSFGGPFIFDDPGSIVENQTIRQLWNIREVLSPPAQGQAVQRRPIVNLSLAINYAIGGLEVRGYHVFNLGAHILAALTLFGVVRRTLGSSTVSEHLRRVSSGLALVIALIWTVHPLHTDAVSYIIQRTEVLAGLFYLLTLYCVIRGSSSPRSPWWYIAAVAACLLGMGSKESMVSAPLVVLLYDRVFLCSSFREVFRRRWGLYVVLAATWGLVAVYVPQGSEGTAVFGRGLSSLAYASTQFEAIVHYLRLCFWPQPLIIDYGQYKPTSFWQALPYATFIISLLTGTVLTLRYRPGIGFLGVWFFAILAPSSSFVPVLAQASAEKRMYLPLAAVITIVAVCGYAIGRRALARSAISDGGRSRLGRDLGYILAGAVVVILGLLTVRRNYDYFSAFLIWDVTVRECPDNPRAYNNRGNVYARKGEYDVAIRDYENAIQLNPKGTNAYYNRGNAYRRKGNYDQAIRDFDKAIQLNPKGTNAYYNRGNAYSSKGEYDQAIRDFDKAIELDPRHAKVYNNRGIAYSSKGEYDRGIHDFNRAIELNPNHAEAYYNRGRVYNIMGDYNLAIQDFSKPIELSPNYAKAYIIRGATYLDKGDYDRAIHDFNRAIELEPTYAEAHNNLAWILATHPEPRIRDGAEAIRLAERACELENYKVPANLDTLAAAYAEAGQFDQAVETAEEAIQLAQAAKSEKLAKDIQNRLKLYRAKLPFRSSAR